MKDYLKYSYMLFILIIFSVFIYFAITSPFFPFTSNRTHGGILVTRVPETGNAAGELQPGDLITSIGGHATGTCRYLFTNPIYGLKPGESITVQYLRHSANGQSISRQTTIILAQSNPRYYPYLLIIGLVSTLFVLSGLLIIHAHGKTLKHNILLGTSGVLGGFVILATGALNGYRAPGAFFYFIGLPIWTLISIVVHSRWPVDQTDSVITKALFFLTSIVAMIAIILQLTSTAEFVCPSDKLADIADLSLIPVAILGLTNTLVPLLRARAITSDPYQKAQLKTILLAVGIGLGVPILTSMIPEIVAEKAILPPGLVLGITVIIPFSYTVVTYQFAMLTVERYTTFLLFSVLIIGTWLGLATFSIWVVHALYRNFGEPDTLMLAFSTLIPALIFTTVIRE